MASRAEPCPKCREKGRDRRGNNLQRWPDGHAHCFACTYHEFNMQGTVGYMGNILEVEQLKKNKMFEAPDLKLPDDATTSIDAVALIWLAKYDIELNEVEQYDFRWSPSKKMLIFPFYANEYEDHHHEGKLMGWQGRSFNLNSQMQYYKVGGFIDFYNVLNFEGGKGDELIIVEDYISAIKVARQFTTMALLGSQMSTPRMNGLKKWTQHLTFWLDEDKADKAGELVRVATMLGFHAKYVITKHDPKAYDNATIEDILSSHSKKAPRTTQEGPSAPICC